MKSRLIALIIVTVFIVSSGLGSISYAFEEYYTIQTGTYTAVALSHANRHFDSLVQKMKGTDLDFFRLIRTSKYFVVRLGRFDGFSDALTGLEAVKQFVADAFILKESDNADVSIVRAFSKRGPVAGADKNKKEQEPFSKAESQIVTRESPALPQKDEYYTVITGEFRDKDKADAQYEKLSRTLIKKHLSGLRIEKAGKSFTVSLGKFTDHNAAGKFMKAIRHLLPDAEVVRIRGGQGELVRLYDVPAATPAADEKSAAGQKERDEVNKEQSNNRPAGVYVPIGAEKFEDVLNNISSKYYDQQYEEAAELLRRGIEQWPDKADLYAWYGATLLNMKSPEKAYEIYNKAVELSPDVPDYHAGAGYSLLSIYMERAKASIEAFGKALQLDPDNVDALEGLGIVYVSIDKKELAKDILIRLIDIDADAAKRLNAIITHGVEWGQ